MGTRKAEFQSWKSIYHLLCIFLYIHIDLHFNQTISIYICVCCCIICVEFMIYIKFIYHILHHIVLGCVMSRCCLFYLIVVIAYLVFLDWWCCSFVIIWVVCLYVLLSCLFWILVSTCLLCLLSFFLCYNLTSFIFTVKNAIFNGRWHLWNAVGEVSPPDASQLCSWYGKHLWLGWFFLP